MVLTVLLFFTATFAMVAAGVLGYHILLERRTLAGKQEHGRESVHEWIEASDLLKTETLSTITFWDSLLARFRYVDIMKARIAEAGLDWSVGRLTALMLLSGTVVLVVLTRLSWTSTAVSLAAGGAAACVPYFWILRVRRKRLERFEGQFPDALDSLSRALRAGHPLAAGLQMLVYEAPQPLAGEMQKTVNERNLGMSWEQALDNLAARVPLVEVSVFAAAVQLQNRTGGKLNEILGRLSETMREAYALKGEVRSVAAHGRMTGGLLTVLPLVVALLMAVVMPQYLLVLWTHPMGKNLIAAAVAGLVAAHLVIRKLTDIRI